MQNADPTAIHHPERGQRPRRSFAEGALHFLTNYSNQPKRADAKPAQRAGIYEGVFVTLQNRTNIYVLRLYYNQQNEQRTVRWNDKRYCTENERAQKRCHRRLFKALSYA